MPKCPIVDGNGGAKCGLIEQDKYKLASANPVAAALSFKQLADAIMTHVIGTPPEKGRKKSHRPGEHGMCGTNLGWFYVEARSTPPPQRATTRAQCAARA
jgi:hypothetical protein